MQNGAEISATSNRHLYILILILIIDLLSFTCILPLFPSILDGYAKAVPRDELFSKFESSVRKLEAAIGVPNLDRYNNVFLGGVLGSLFSFLQYLSSPLLGALSDVYGRKPILLASIIGSLISYYIWSISTTFSLFVLSRIVGGLSKASVSISTAIVSDLCSSAQRGRGMAFVGVAFSVAFILGPMIGAYFSAASKIGTNSFMNAPFFAMTLTVIELFLVITLLPETLKFNKKEKKSNSSSVLLSAYNYISPKSIFKFTPVQKFLKQTSLNQARSYGAVYFIYLFLYSALEFTLSFHTHILFRYDGMQQGKMYFFVGILMIIIQGGYVRRIANDKHHRYAFIGLLTIVPAYILISFAETQLIFYAGLCLYSIASAIVVPCLTTLVSQLSPESEKGVTMGVFRSIGALSRALGPIFGSLTFWLLGPKYCYALGAVLFAIPLVMLRRVQSTSHHSVVAATKKQ